MTMERTLEITPGYLVTEG